jgi:phage tail sheath gpL-like
MTDTVAFNQVPDNVRVPGSYYEFNAGQSPYQGNSRTLLIGQKTNAGSAPVNAPMRLNGDPSALFGAGSMLSDMAVYARQGHPLGEIWCLPLADTGTAQIKTVTIGVGILGSVGVLKLYICGEKIQLPVAATDTNVVAAANLVALINQGYVKFGRTLAFPVIAAVDGGVPSQVNLTARNAGALGVKIPVDKDLVGDEGPLAQFITIAAPTPGAGTPSLAAALAALGDMEFDWIGAPYADATSLDAIKAFLADRWGPMKEIYGHYRAALFDTYANFAAAGAARNDPNAGFMGVVESSSPPWVWAAAEAVAIAKDKDMGVSVDQAYRITVSLNGLELVGVKPPKLRINWLDKTQRNQLLFDGVSTFTVDVDGTVRIDKSITTYQTDSSGNPDITWLDVETRAQAVYFGRYNRMRIAQSFPRCVLADDNPSGNPKIVTIATINAEYIHIYKELERGGLVQNSALYAQRLITARSSVPNRVDNYLPFNVANRLEIFGVNATTFLLYPA